MAGRCAPRQEICGTAPYELLKLVENMRIPPTFANLLFHGLQRIGDGKGVLIRSLGGQCIVNVDNLQHPGGNGDRFPSQSVRISRSVEFLMMMPDDRKYLAKCLKGLSDALTDNRLFVVQHPFLSGKLARLQQNGIRHRNFSDVVYYAGTAQRDNLVL